MDTRFDYVDNGVGWELQLKRVVDPERFRPGTGNPVVIVPGYGMNAFIFGFHPTGPSLEEYLAGRGFEVWSLYLRAQEGTRRLDGSRRFGMAEVAIRDLTASFDHIARVTETGSGMVHALGCSLGGTYLFIHATCVPDHRIGALVSMGAPLRWNAVHPILRAMASSPRLLGLVPFARTRELARVALPLLTRFPSLLQLYLHPDIVDLDHVDSLVQTVEDPVPRINREVAQWIRDKDLLIDGRNVTDGMRAFRAPLLVVIASHDGIVPLETAMSPFEIAASADKQILNCGGRDVRMAHADLFISDPCQERVFAPVADWLAERGDGLAGAAPKKSRGRKRQRAGAKRKAKARTKAGTGTEPGDAGDPGTDAPPESTS